MLKVQKYNDVKGDELPYVEYEVRTVDGVTVLRFATSPKNCCFIRAWRKRLIFAHFRGIYFIYTILKPHQCCSTEDVAILSNYYTSTRNSKIGKWHSRI